MIKYAFKCLAVEDASENWTVAITDASSMIISRANGVTWGVAGMRKAGREIMQMHGRTLTGGIYIANKFTKGASNHSEMCILAAAERLGERVTDLECGAQNCGACGSVIQAKGITNTSPAGSGRSQTGWSHPYVAVFIGTQKSDEAMRLGWWEQVELLDTDPIGARGLIGKFSTSDQPLGKYVKYEEADDA
ncbi:hypothetical protein [Streptacidiphilus melanogenes]|uniref:hypothetical protein n=1 Tax=Streptacidiphilus melanogenes TaxID=411235 RepID=UPI0012699506|nr:hypothetical protein [Streptacidiphilus melanogenes]